jgi:TolA-binding protein
MGSSIAVVQKPLLYGMTNMTQKVHILNLHKRIDQLITDLKGEARAHVEGNEEIEKLESKIERLQGTVRTLRQDNSAMRVMLGNLAEFAPVKNTKRRPSVSVGDRYGDQHRGHRPKSPLPVPGWINDIKP